MKHLMLGMLLGIVGCSPAPEIKYTQIINVISPSRSHELLVMRQDPGALGSLSTAVFLRAVDTTARGERIFVAKGEPNVIAEWLSETHASVRHSAKAEDIFSSKESVGGITIEYASK